MRLTGRKSARRSNCAGVIRRAGGGGGGLFARFYLVVVPMSIGWILRHTTVRLGEYCAVGGVRVHLPLALGQGSTDLHRARLLGDNYVPCHAGNQITITVVCGIDGGGAVI